MRINKFLAACGLGSRRAVEDIVLGIDLGTGSAGDCRTTAAASADRDAIGTSIVRLTRSRHRRGRGVSCEVWHRCLLRQCPPTNFGL